MNAQIRQRNTLFQFSLFNHVRFNKAHIRSSSSWCCGLRKFQFFFQKHWIGKWDYVVDNWIYWVIKRENDDEALKCLNFKGFMKNYEEDEFLGLILVFFFISCLWLRNIVHSYLIFFFCFIFFLFFYVISSLNTCGLLILKKKLYIHTCPASALNEVTNQRWLCQNWSKRSKLQRG